MCGEFRNLCVCVFLFVVSRKGLFLCCLCLFPSGSLIRCNHLKLRGFERNVVWMCSFCAFGLISLHLLVLEMSDCMGDKPNVPRGLARWFQD